jgi:hypothetical protein
MHDLLALPVAGLARVFRLDVVDLKEVFMSEAVVEAAGSKGLVEDWSRDKQVFGVPWGKVFSRWLHDGSYFDDGSVAQPE